MQICQYHNKKLCIFAVAPFAGATGLKCFVSINIIEVTRRSLRGSVDWNFLNLITCERIFVAPFAGAWIEIRETQKGTNMKKSLPSRERGLKSLLVYQDYLNFVSLPSRERGLKCLWWLSCVPRHSRSLRGSVDWNIIIVAVFVVLPCRSLRGSVDWNASAIPTVRYPNVAPFAGAWIEIALPFCRFSCWVSLPSRERGLKYRKTEATPTLGNRRSLRGSVDWNSMHQG